MEPNEREQRQLFISWMLDRVMGSLFLSGFVLILILWLSDTISVPNIAWILVVLGVLTIMCLFAEDRHGPNRETDQST